MRIVDEQFGLSSVIGSMLGEQVDFDCIGKCSISKHKIG